MYLLLKKVEIKNMLSYKLKPGKYKRYLGYYPSAEDMDWANYVLQKIQ